MHGKVKWFSKEKGFGFIVSETGQDYFFGVRDIQGVDLPDNKDDVSFEPRKGKKGPAANSINILKRHYSKEADNKITCSGCDKHVFPKLVTHYGEPDKSFCPFCGTMLKDFVGTGNRVMRALMDLLP